MVATFTYGPLVLVFVAGLLAGFCAVGPWMSRTNRPELPLLAVLLWSHAMLIGMLAVAERFQLDALGLLILPAAAACVLFPSMLATAYVGLTVGLLVCSAFVIDPARVSEAPPILILPIGALLTITLPAIMVRRLELRSRDSAMVDPLTGALNRVALELRLSEISDQRTTGLSLRLGVLMIDLDHFKAINDGYGHAAGDEVLAGAVRRIRGVVGPLTPIYRAGGEEFVLLLAGADADASASVAEDLCSAIRERPIADRSLTVSIGVASSLLDAAAPRDLVNAADGALYAAKRAGRDRVSQTDAAQNVVADAASEGPAKLAVVADQGGTGEVRREPLATSVRAFGDDARNWLVRGDFEREHIRRSARAMASTHHGALGMIGLALVASIPWIGYKLMLPSILPLIAYHVVERRIGAMRRPEYALGAAWLGVQLSIFAGALLADPGEPYMLILFVTMMIGMTAVFPTRGITVGSIVSMGLALLGGGLARPDLVFTYPGLIVPPVILIAGFSLMSSTAGRTAIDFSTQAIIDPLTGLLTRSALQSRLRELEKQAAIGAGQVSVIAFDIDNFKTLNDTYGHPPEIASCARSAKRLAVTCARLSGDSVSEVTSSSSSPRCLSKRRASWPPYCAQLSRQPTLTGEGSQGRLGWPRHSQTSPSSSTSSQRGQMPRCTRPSAPVAIAWRSLPREGRPARGTPFRGWPEVSGCAGDCR